MKNQKSFLLAFSMMCSVLHIQGQGTFQNLGFESAFFVRISGDPYDRVQFAPAFPGWNGYVGGVPQTAALTNNVFLDTSGISIINHNWSNPFGGPGGLIEGNFTAILQAGIGGDTTLSQTGLVSAGTQSLQFKVYQQTSGVTLPGPFVVALSGQTLSLVPLAAGANYTLFGADIHTWAGQTANLSFTIFAEQPHIDNQYLYLDSIVFSPVAIPEPSGLALFGVGTLLFGFFRLRNPSR